MRKFRYNNYLTIVICNLLLYMVGMIALLNKYYNFFCLK